MALKAELDRIGMTHDWLTGDKESLISRARMEMTRTFLRERPEFTHLCWLDADIEFGAEDIAKLWNLNADIAVAFYCMKRPDMPLSAWKDGKLVRLEDCPKEPFEVDFAGTGFMLIKRECLEGTYNWLQDREKKCRDLVYRLKNAAFDAGLVDECEFALLDAMLDGVAADYEGQWGEVPALFNTPIHTAADGRYLESEDYFFCRIARAAGYKIIGDPSIRLGHYGMFRYGNAAA